eukprot:CAMPEP_0117048894 /NCGR_PEP_ID=MMETSP0472-20121206/33804_1 /TAXON_ID=693140 ORGANISM="Tiarina fusus, Strain LIS" /NCGR_SAMPLE_ID=MMETSP0472 /ASSEMBLY_ACC=CAM_ASM_000603 /LENGTH=76 /DNA_ID=CAMNT_0004762179 /DNA_START=8 /DNA_END=238 /DNA_ORIENTATION=-
MTFATIQQLHANTINTIADAASAHGLFANTPLYSGSSPPGNRPFGAEKNSILGMIHRYHTGLHHGARFGLKSHGVV